MRKDIQMVDLRSQYLRYKTEIDKAIQDVVDSCYFIGGPAVKNFAQQLSEYLNVAHVIPCANGTDALQIALMALDLNPGDEVIVPAFTYAATAEVVGLLGLVPVMCDVDPINFNSSINEIKPYLSEKTKAVVPVHLFGQCADMKAIMEWANENNLYVIEDNAQAIGSDYLGYDTPRKAGTIAHIGTSSFYPSKNLGAYGDGGAIFTNDDDLAEKIRMVANHGQNKRYYHDIIGCNSRLDAIQAALLSVKLEHLDEFCDRRRTAADYYDQALASVNEIEIPKRSEYSTHVFHQYTLKVKNSKRDELANYLSERNIPTSIFYPLPLYKQNAFANHFKHILPSTEQLCQEVISIPIHTELTEDQQAYISNGVIEFFKHGS